MLCVVVVARRCLMTLVDVILIQEGQDKSMGWLGERGG